VYVPRRGHVNTILPGSGIVGGAWPDDRHREPGYELIDYEGAAYGQSGMSRWVERVMHADGRQRQRYPTVARISVERHGLVRVGAYDPELERILLDHVGDGSENLAWHLVEHWLGKTLTDDELILRPEGATWRTQHRT
jgi:hypothetical protein